MIYRRIYWCLATLTIFALEGGCSDIRRDTYEVELTTDQDSHPVELWYQPNERSNALRAAYRLEFPQSYYGYRDNHHYLKQTTIGLLLEKPGLAPLASVIAKEVGIHEPLSIGPYQEGALKRQVAGSFANRKLWVIIWGLTGRPPLSRGDMPRIFAAAPVLYHDVDLDFDIIEKTTAAGYSKRFPLIRGYSSNGSVIIMSCSSGVPNCSFETEYRNSRIHFVLPRSEAATAHTIVPKLVSLIERHLVKGKE